MSYLKFDKNLMINLDILSVRQNIFGISRIF